VQLSADREGPSWQLRWARPRPQGLIAAIVYAIEIATGFALAIPVDTLRRLADSGGFEDIPACG
jgi:hypothetical protein